MAVYCHMSSLSVRADRDPVGTPPRPPRSLRRTTSHDVTWPEGLSGPMTAVCCGRDLHTGPTGATTTTRTVDITARAGFDDGKVTHIATHVDGLDLAPLAGTAAFSGFRLAAAQLLPAEHPARSLAYQLLDDLPIAFLLSGRVLRAEGISLGTPNRRLPVDVCAGGAVIARAVDMRSGGGQWNSLGTFTLPAGSSPAGASVLIRTEATNGYVVADAARFVPV